jgi:arsenite methyltransferase
MRRRNLDMSEKVEDDRIKEAVRQAYGGIARQFVGEAEARAASSCCSPAQQAPTQASSCCSPAQQAPTQASSCCSPAQQAPTQASSCCSPAQPTAAPATGAERFYSDEELNGLPDSVTGASLGCGNPLAIADLRPGEVVLDLGSGGGIDCFLAARQVGPEGYVIGLDMTTDMLKLARRNARRMGVTNVEFQWGEMEEIPLPDASVDAVISNCVINLSPDKDAVFAEAFRVLRPGGRLSVSDMVIDGALPAAVRKSLDAWAGCAAGALDQEVYLRKMRAAGFQDVEVLSRDTAEGELVEGDELQLQVVGSDGQPVSGEEAHALLEQAGLSAVEIARKIASVKVRARKPA